MSSNLDKKPFNSTMFNSKIKSSKSSESTLHQEPLPDLLITSKFMANGVTATQVKKNMTLKVSIYGRMARDYSSLRKI